MTIRGRIALFGAFMLLGGTARAQQSNDLFTRYQEATGRIAAAAMADSTAWERTAYITDTFGPRLSGSKNLEEAIKWIVTELRRDGLDRVRTEPVKVPVWERGEESLTLVHPRTAPIRMLGLGGSIATPEEGITADVLVVSSFDELIARKAEAKGKIVVYDAPFVSYGETVQYRVRGASRAAEFGAVAALVRSITPHNMRTPHTGSTGYAEGIRKIPTAAITPEDAMMLHRMQESGSRPRVRLKMSARTLPDAESSNVIAEIRGSERPEEVVVIGGHVDSWDVGTGAMDDMGGCVVSWQALNLIRKLGLRPRRTIRLVMWANEENGLRGGLAYRDTHQAELDNHILAIETDGGVFTPQGFAFSGDEAALPKLREIGRLLESVGAGNITTGGGGADISPIMRHGVPGMSPIVDSSRYFWYHHTDADTVDKLDPREMNLCAAAMAIMAYVTADMPERLPRTYQVPTH